jgi:hypothetical protein
MQEYQKQNRGNTWKAECHLYLSQRFWNSHIYFISTLTNSCSFKLAHSAPMQKLFLKCSVPQWAWTRQNILKKMKLKALFKILPKLMWNCNKSWWHQATFHRVSNNCYFQTPQLSTENTCFLGCDAGSLGHWLPPFLGCDAGWVFGSLVTTISGMWCWVFGPLVSAISKDHVTFIFNSNHTTKTTLHGLMKMKVRWSFKMLPGNHSPQTQPSC